MKQTRCVFRVIPVSSFGGRCLKIPKFWRKLQKTSVLRFLGEEIVLRGSTIVEIGFLVLSRKVQTLYFVYIACAGERLLLLVVVCRERSVRNNRLNLAIEVRSTSGGIQSKVVHDTMQKMTGLSWKLSYGFQLEEEGRWDGLFHTRVVVQERSCAMTIDHMSLIKHQSQ